MVNLKQSPTLATVTSFAPTVAVSVTRMQMAAPGGATLSVAPTIYREWLSLGNVRTATGQTVQASLGWPLEDFTLPSGAEVVYFERGAIVLRPDGRAYPVYGTIYLHYRDLYDVKTGAGLGVGLPHDAEHDVPGGRRQSFDNADIYWNASTNAAFEVHGGIRDKWNARGGVSGFLGYPLSDELSVRRGAAEVGRSQQFTGGSIFWSPGTGAFAVQGGIREAYVHTYNGAIGALGFPVSDETSSPRGGKRYSNFQHGCIVWTAATGRIDTYTSLDVFVQSINGSGSHTFFEQIGTSEVWLYANVDITSNTGISQHFRLPQGGDYHHPSASPGKIYTVSPMRGDLVLTVRLDGWDHCLSTSDQHLGTICSVLCVDDDFFVNNPQHLNSGDMHGTLDMRRISVDNPNDPNFRRDFFWGFDNVGTPELTRAQYGQTFTDVESSESSAHWFNDLFYNDVYKTIAKGGNCFGMCLESCFAERNDSLFSEPIYPIPIGTAIDEINKKQAYQLGAPYLDWFVANFLTLQFWDPANVYHAAKRAWDSGDLPLICLTSTDRGGGHCVRPCGPNAFSDRGACYVIEVANPNAPGTDDANNANMIVIDKATNTYSFYLWHDGTQWTGGKLTGGIMSWVPFSAICREPRTPFWEALTLALGAGLILLGDGAQTTQISDDKGRTLYKAERAGKSSRWDDLNVGAAAIPGLVRVPMHAAFLSRGPMINAMVKGGVFNAKPQSHGPEVYRIVGLPSPYGPAPTHSDPQSTTGQGATMVKAVFAQPFEAMKASAGAAMVADVGAPGQMRHLVSAGSAAPYRWGFHTSAAAVVATVSGAGHGDDEFHVERIGGTDQQLTLRAANAGTTRNAQIAMRTSMPQRGAASFTIGNVTIPAGAAFSASVVADGHSLQLRNAGGDANVTIELQSGAAGTGAKTLAIPAGKTAVIAPADWSRLQSAPVVANIMGAPGASIDKSFAL